MDKEYIKKVGKEIKEKYQDLYKIIVAASEVANSNKSYDVYSVFTFYTLKGVDLIYEIIDNEKFLSDETIEYIIANKKMLYKFALNTCRFTGEQLVKYDIDINDYMQRHRNIDESVYLSKFDEIKNPKHRLAWVFDDDTEKYDKLKFKLSLLTS